MDRFFPLCTGINYTYYLYLVAGALSAVFLISFIIRVILKKRKKEKVLDGWNIGILVVLALLAAFWAFAAFMTYGGLRAPSGCVARDVVIPTNQTSTIATKNRFGSQAGHEKFAKEEKEAGMDTERIWIDWAEIEPQKDAYNWDVMDMRVKTALDNGIDPLAYVDSVPTWAKKNKACTANICAITDMSEFRQMIKDVAARYDGKHGKGEVKYIEILNEVTLPDFFDVKNTNYKDWLVAGSEGAREGNPNVQVLIGAFVNPTSIKTFVDDMLQNYGTYYDIISYHVYDQDSDMNDATVYLKQRMQNFGVQKPLWITETSSLGKPGDPDIQNILARGVIKRHAAAFGNGVERVYWWPFAGTPTKEEDAKYGDAKGKTVGLGWVYPKKSGMPEDFHPRQAYQTYKLLTSKIKGFITVQKITDTQYKFTVNGKNVYILWGSGALPAEITGQVTVTDFLGKATTMDAKTIQLTEDPIFVE